jgi:Lactonase, 7-bladed beta-propeller
MRLYLSSYTGAVTTLELRSSRHSGFSLRVICSTMICAPNPSWLTLDLDNSTVYCTEPGVTSGVAGSLHSLKILPDDSLLPLSSISTPIGAAHTAMYGTKQALGIAY